LFLKREKEKGKKKEHTHTHTQTHTHTLFTVIRTLAVELKTLQLRAVFKIFFNAAIPTNNFDH